jgi:hypothetical protein
MLTHKNRYNAASLEILDQTLKKKNYIGAAQVKGGSSTGTGAQQTIAHGFTVAPTRVLLSEYTTGGALPYLSATSDSRNIYVTATNLMTYVWRAEVE